eukprot:TRINITY_DN1917_c0_g1_i5.p3 TRINITY_DN1917_c0_g1~~TRINITY_DN1917_c0_g1_i5.p3  ORF type:complete len:231 (-),score=-10.19 TRINITY_DN1917_c0_g1_i5:769-1461(-)
MSVYCVFSFYVFIFSHLQTNIANDVSLVNFNVLIILPKQTSMSILFYKRFWQFLVVFNSKRCRETSYGQIIIFNILVFKSFFGLRNVILYLSEISANIYIFYIFRLFIHIFRDLKIYIFKIFKIICRYFRNLQIIVGQIKFFKKFDVLIEGICLFQIITFIFVDIIVVSPKEVLKKMRHTSTNTLDNYSFNTTTKGVFYSCGHLPDKIQNLIDWFYYYWGKLGFLKNLLF